MLYVDVVVDGGVGDELPAAGAEKNVPWNTWMLRMRFIASSRMEAMGVSLGLRVEGLGDVLVGLALVLGMVLEVANAGFELRHAY